MRFLIIGLGSMGKRRIRCLKSLGYTEIYGFDLREDRRKETEKKYEIKTFFDYDNALEAAKPDALIISVPPDVHHIYMKSATAHKIHFFVEASVTDTDMDNIIEDVKKLDIIAAPSATFIFHPAIKRIKEIIKSGELGKISNIVHHTGQFLPDWHTYEKVSDFYVSNPITGGGREMVPFELTWITKLFGFPYRVCANVRSTINIEGAEKIDDTYNILLDYNNFLITMTVDVVSRYATRRLLINGSEKQLLWEWDQNVIRIYDPKSSEWKETPYDLLSAEEGYNPNIGENMYIDEIKSFIKAIKGKCPFENTMKEDHKVLKLLYAIEESDKTSKFVRIKE